MCQGRNKTGILYKSYDVLDPQLGELLVPLSLLLELPELLLPLLPDTFFLLPVLKSVSYHPPPFKRNAAAETNFFKVDAPHAGHSVSGASDIFCNFSSRCEQLSH